MNPPDYRLAALTRPLARRDLLTPALCFLACHRPLAFVTGQFLYLLEPLATLVGRPGLAAWADLVSDPHRLAELEYIWSLQPGAATSSLEYHDHRQ